METVARPIRIAHIVTRMNTGGVAVLIAAIFREYDRSAYDLTLITGVCQNGEEDYLQAQGLNLNEIQISAMNRTLNPLKDLTAFISIIRALNQLKPDIVHTHTSKAGLLGRIASKIACPRAKVVHTYHGHLLQGYFSSTATKLIVLTEKYLARISDLLVSMGNHVKKELIAAGVGEESQFQVFFPGVTVSSTITSSLEVSSFTSKYPDKLICTFVGRLSKIKRCDRIIELAKMTELQDQSIHFLIIGDGELRYELETNSHDLPISFTGWQSNSSQWLAISDIAILFSDNEAVPLAMIEAGLAGLPLVGTNVGSMADVVIDGVNGFLTSTKIEEIGAALLRLAKDPELREEMGNAGRKLAKTRFSTEAMVSAHQNMYSQLMLRNN
jgi:glycosyltransferase involved in cell wall biosynthesis